MPHQLVMKNRHGAYVGEAGEIGVPYRKAKLYDPGGAHGISVAHGYEPVSAQAEAKAPRRVYVAGPITLGDHQAHLNAASLTFCHLAAKGYAAFVPQWSMFSATPAMKAGDRVIAVASPSSIISHAEWMRNDLAWLAVSDALLRLPGESVGADEEVRFAEAHEIPVYRDVRALCGEYTWRQRFRVAGVDHYCWAYRESDLRFSMWHALTRLGVQTAQSVDPPEELV